MKRLITLLLITCLCLFIFSACNSNQTVPNENSGEDLQANSNSGANTNPTNEPSQNSQQTDTNVNDTQANTTNNNTTNPDNTTNDDKNDTTNNTSSDNNLVSINDLTIGSTFNGAKVKSINYEENYIFDLSLIGEFTFSGSFMYDDFEGGFRFNTNEDQKLPTKLVIEDMDNYIMEMPNSLMFYGDSLNSFLSNETINKLQSDMNEKIDATITVKNYAYSENFAIGAWESGEIVKFDLKNPPLDIPSKEENDLSKGYTYGVENGELKLKYNNTGNEIVIVKPKQSTNLEEAIVDIINVQKSNDGKSLFFETQVFATTNAIHKINLETFDEQFFSDGWFVQNVAQAPYDNCVIIKRTYIKDGAGRVASYFVYDEKGTELCELGNTFEQNNLVSQITTAIEKKNLGLKGYTNEAINGIQVNYDECIAVVVPMYKGVNEENMMSRNFSIPNGGNAPVNFAIFGKASNVKILYTKNAMEEEYKITNIGDIANEIITIYSSFPFDFSAILVQMDIETVSGNYESIEFGMDDIRDISDYKPILITK